MSEEKKDLPNPPEIESFNNEPVDANEMTPEELEEASGGVELEGAAACKIHDICIIN